MKINNILTICMLMLILSCNNSHNIPESRISKIPNISPEYINCTFPCNIAAPQFSIKEKGDIFRLEIGMRDSVFLSYVSDSPNSDIDLEDWKKLLSTAKDDSIFFRISTLNNQHWLRYNDIYNRISSDTIDDYLVYRLLYPGYELWFEIGIYQRKLSDYNETPILENKDFERQCINCHSFANNSSKHMMLHVRGKSGGTLICNNEHIEKINTKLSKYPNAGTYPSWHPSARFIAFSMNNIIQAFHAKGHKTIEVADMASDLMVYDIQRHTIYSDTSLCNNNYMDTYPCWHPDGKTLYFCRTKQPTAQKTVDSTYYDLYRTTFDTTTRSFGTPTLVYNASQLHKSISFPRVSPDGKYILLVIADYGNFSIWHSESELALLDISSGTLRIIDEVNSPDVESFHSWSSSGKWFVFSSKRMDGLWARPFFAHFDTKTGRAEKPFLLPQKNPEFYDTFTKTFNIPELVTTPISHQDYIKTIYQPATNAIP